MRKHGLEHVAKQPDGSLAVLWLQGRTKAAQACLPGANVPEDRPEEVTD
jgi:hypothetical protein